MSFKVDYPIKRVILPPTRSAKCHDKQAKRPKAQRMAQNFDDSCIAVAVPCVTFLGPIRPTQERLRMIAS